METEDKFELYEGTEKYIFVSYCHKDKEKVFRIIEKLKRKGYRIWYDQGIYPGSEWPEIVAQQLDGSYIFMPFLSENYIKSQNCVREIHFAAAKKKNILAVMLESVELTLGIEMQLCASQVIKKYEYKEECFYETLFLSEILEECLQKKAVEEKRITKAEKIEVKIEKKKPSPKGNKRNKMLLRVLMLAVVLAVWWMVYHKLNTITIDGQEFSRKDTGIILEEKSVTGEMMEKMQELKELSSVTFEKCEIKKDALRKLSGLKNLRSLKMNSCKGVDNDSFQINQKMESIARLEITNSPELSDVQWISNMPNLTTVTLSENNIENVDSILNLEQLSNLDLQGNQIKNISGVMKSLRIRELNLSDNQISDISGLSNLTVLRSFYFGGNHYAEKNDNNTLDFLVKSAATLKYVDLSENDLSELELSKLRNCTRLEELKLDKNARLNSLVFLENINSIERLSASGCNLSDVNGLENNRNLTKIDLSNNQIVSLEKFPNLNTENSVRLYLNQNKLTDVSYLPEEVFYSELLLYGNEINEESVKKLQALEGNIIGFTYNDKVSPEKKLKFGWYYLEDVPLDMRVAFEDKWSGCHFGTIDKEGNVEEQ